MSFQHPWAVAVLKENKKEDKLEVHCSGALITPSHVLSAGHCFSGRNPANSKLPIDKLTLAFGLDDINNLKSFLPIQFRKINATYPYKTYRYPSSYYDVAVVELSKPVELGPQTWPICLPDFPNQNQDHMMEYSAVLVGYGPETDDSSKLNQIKHKIEPTYVCNGLYLPENSAITKRENIRSLVARDLPNLFNDKSVICASDIFNTDKGTCPGDSGAPLIRDVRNRTTLQIQKTLVAVLHGGLERCDNSDYPAIYTRITTPEIWNWLMNNFVNKIETAITTQPLSKTTTTTSTTTKSPPVDCKWSEWEMCSASCGSGMETRVVEQPALNGGTECLGNATRQCKTDPCPTTITTTTTTTTTPTLRSTTDIITTGKQFDPSEVLNYTATHMEVPNIVFICLPDLSPKQI